MTRGSFWEVGRHARLNVLQPCHQQVQIHSIATMGSCSRFHYHRSLRVQLHPVNSWLCLFFDYATYPTRTTAGSNRIMDREYEPDQTVLHIQSPNLSKTFIQCPLGLLVPEKEVAERNLTRTMASSSSLGLGHPWIHWHVRNLGKERSFSRLGLWIGEGDWVFSDYQRFR